MKRYLLRGDVLVSEEIVQKSKHDPANKYTRYIRTIKDKNDPALKLLKRTK